jgi:predicted RNase H-like HicB family nuclease
MKQSILQNVVRKEGRYYVAQCLNIDIPSFGETKADALKNLDEAFNLYFEDDKQ